MLLAGSCLLLHQPGVEGGDVVGVSVVGHQAIDSHQLFLLIGPHLLKVPGRAGLHLLELEPLLGLGVRKSNLVLGRLGASDRLADAQAGADDAHHDGNGKGATHGSDPHELKEQSTLCPELGVRRDEGEPHPPQPLDMHHVTSICEIEKDLVPALHPIQVVPGFP